MRQYWTIAALFSLLAGIVCMPGLLLERDRGEALNEVVLYPVGAVELDSPQKEEREEQELSLWERVDRINHASAMVQTAGYTDLQENEDLFLKLEEQLTVLRSFGALPVFSRAETAGITITQCGYLAPEKPGFMIRVWVISIQYGDVSICVHMDVETDVIYNVLVIAEGNFPLIYGKDDPREGFLSYLQNCAGGESEPPDTLLLRSVCETDRMYLGLTGETIQTGTVLITDGSTQIHKP